LKRHFTANVTLEAILQAKCNGAISPIVQVPTEVGTVQAVDWSSVTILIERVQEVSTENQSVGILASSYRKDFSNTQIGVVKTRSAESVLSKVAISQTIYQRQSVGSKRHDELTTNERAGERAEVARDRIEDQSPVRIKVRPVTATAVTVRVNARKYGEGLARLACNYTRKLPAAKDLTPNAVLEEVVPERRNFIDEVGDETMLAIEG